MPLPGKGRAHPNHGCGADPIVVAYGAGVDSAAMLIGLRDRNILPVLILFADKGNATSPPPAARVRRDAVARLRRLRPCPVRRRCGRSDRSLRQKIEKDEAMTAENANGEQQHCSHRLPCTPARRRFSVTGPNGLSIPRACRISRNRRRHTDSSTWRPRG
jgi:hypothetical protein